MAGKRPRRLKWLAVALVLLILLGTSRDGVYFNPAQQVAAAYTYDLVLWHTGNFLSKWSHRLERAFLLQFPSEQVRRQQVQQYFSLSESASQLQSQLEGAIAQDSPKAGSQVSAIEKQLAEITGRRQELRNDVEETLEATIGAIISDADLASWGKFTFPPVDIRLSAIPKLLVTSPRDRIQRTHNVLIDSGITVAQRALVEDELQERWNFSALVLDLGGVATYPASVPDTQPLLSTLRISAHEWLHHYFFFRPLGQNMLDDADMQTLNETAADLIAREIGDQAFQRLASDPEFYSAPAQSGSSSKQLGDSSFNFNLEMQQTRLQVDSLLAQGKVEEAESYMEQRRRFFVANGRNIRKLNQAYFAFYGTYGESPASTSPIAGQLHQLRELIPDLGTFVDVISGVSSYRQFLETLEQSKSSSNGSRHIPHSARGVKV